MPTEATTSARRVRTAEREKQALTLRIAGSTYEQIGEQLEISTQGAYRIIKRLLERTHKQAAESTEELRQIEGQRLDALAVSMWAAATTGDFGAVDRVLRVMERRARLLGLDAPAKADVTSGGVPITFHVVYEG